MENWLLSDDSWFDTAMNQLDDDFDNGYITVSEYSQMRRELIQEYESEMQEENYIN